MRIPRSFAVATHEVTFEQFQSFCKATGERYTPPSSYAPDENGPAIQVSWLAAARYCRWLSDQDKDLPDDQKCFPPLAEIKEGMRLPADYLTRTGYRLPTEAEWEYACRARTVTARPYGSAEEMLSHYAWHIRNSEDRVHPVGQLKPNDFGMFDMLGNAWEWVLGHKIEYPPEGWIGVREDREDPAFADSVSLDNIVVRGGAFSTLARKKVPACSRPSPSPVPLNVPVRRLSDRPDDPVRNRNLGCPVRG